MHPTEKVNIRTEDRHRGPQTTIMFGNYEGGRIWIEGEGNEPPPSICLNSTADKGKLGTFISTNNQWTTIPDQGSYCIEPVKTGIRYAATLCTPNSSTLLTPQQLIELKDLGFPGVPSNDTIDLSRYRPGFTFDPGDIGSTI